MPPEFKIIIYLSFVIAIYIVQSLSAYIIMLAVISVFLLRIPFRSLKSGWLPISFFLAFTFLSNVFFSHGKILYSIGSMLITEEGLRLSAVRTLRIFFMVVGAKILTATTPLDVMVEALRKTLSPLEKIGMPVGDFFSVMGLTLKCFPRLKDYLAENYRNHKNNTESQGFWGRVNIVSSFLLPMFIQSIQSPEMFFQEREENPDLTA
ncbi:MAG: hypothetical protein HY035_11500 [Nitrospirae bacterium]|nr:hypothetical protein [Nitrospirota bacterium]